MTQIATPLQTKNKKNKKKVVLPYLQRIGKSLMFPIAILPFAAIFLRLSDIIPNTTEFSTIIKLIISTIGNAVFGPILPVIFAIGISFGLSKDQRGEAALVGFVIMIMLQIFLSLPGQGFAGAGIGLVDKIYGNIKVSPPGFDAKYGFEQLFTTILQGGVPLNKYQSIMVDNVFNGIVVGILVSTIYNTFNGIELPSVLGFFSGRRLIPVLSLIFGLVFGIFWVLVFPWVAWCLFYLSDSMGKATGNKYANAAIMGGFVFMNRMLIPFGMHHIPNTIFWFTLGEFTNNTTPPEVVQGDINIFLKGDVWSSVSGYNNAGTFQTGFFPFMMFGLPALSFAFYKCAKDKEQAKRVAQLMFGSSLVAFFTGITEPLEFSFMFISPMLYLIHAALAAFWALIVGLMGIQLGFGFSAGFVDFVLSIPKSLEIINAKLNGVYESGVQVAKPVYNQVEAIFANPWMLLPVGLLCGTSYYWVIKLCVKHFNISTPGRGNNLLNANDELDSMNDISIEGFNSNKYTKDALWIINGVGGKNNISNLEWCATRLRFTLKDNSNVNLDLISKSSSKGTMKVASTGFQVIIGTTVEMYGNEIQRLLSSPNIIEKLSENLDLSKSNPQMQNIQNNTITANISNEEFDVWSIGNGNVFKLENVDDEIFKNKILGDGIVFDCLDGNVYSPIDGTLSVLAPTKHAYGIENENGVSLLIHIGVDTVKLDTDKIFKTDLKQGQKIKKGQLLCKYDRDQVIKEKYEHRVIFLVTPDSKKQLKSKTRKLKLSLNDIAMKLK